MAEVPEGFPTRLTDKQLVESIGDWTQEYRHRWPTSTLPELVIAFINTASQEQLRRQMVKATNSAKWASGLALVVSAGALVVSIVSLFVE